ncbi:DUF6602 domain-containing protein [Burkholderia sp. Bp9142]|uniref:DUF6602 domain-containing protein n=1 Tax=Burkholderia sp. Bp9142 TaxID=2184573 RepID=UPI000F5AFE9F|nr:DUF6602 domain-containing protein [Burkholderia sp. Bp9142]RQR34807.1 hypothetical protein DIE22_16085 [Burkholderia sp. Bp9142]
MNSTPATSPDTDWMRDSFINVQEQLRLSLMQAQLSIAHPGTQGDVTEGHWIDVLRAYLPKRYEVASGLVIDSTGGRSHQIDVVIFDKHFTPTLLDQQNHRYIPAEAVYAVFEAKPDIDKSYLTYAGEKAASVRRLIRTSVAIAHAGGTYPPKPLFPIVAGILAPKASWSDGLGKSFRDNLPSAADEQLDCGCALDAGAFDVFDGSLNIVSSRGSLMYFLFRLLAKLQSLGSVPAIDWGAYASIVANVGGGANPSTLSSAPGP